MKCVMDGLPGIRYSLHWPVMGTCSPQFENDFLFSFVLIFAYFGSLHLLKSHIKNGQEIL
jgi:hypothetical protein